ncbi:MAG TPA: cytochrome c oxidase assembly protein [Actinomycetota bacterium]|nr:cytochrome c oxidase assembly protein [Actinomycetota bacterium]
MAPLAHGGVEGSPWTWAPQPDVWALVAVLVAGYLLAPNLLRGRDAPRPEPRRQALYAAGVLALWAGADWPLHGLSEDYLFSAHMVQHMLFTFVAPPLMLAGLPKWMLEDLLRPRPVGAAVRFLTRPMVALLSFNVVIAVTHWPPLVDASLRSAPFHLAVHCVLFVTAACMWWPVVDPLPSRRSLSPPAKMLYLFLQSVVPTVPASFLTFASSPLYEGYALAPRLWPGFDVVTDQRVAGLIMKLGGGLLLWGVIAVLFFRWNAAEESTEDDVLTWDDFERELEAWDLRR